MKIIVPFLQIIVALGLLNVWVVRFNKRTPYRGGNAANLVEEFSVYGLPKTLLYLVGGLKIAIAVALLAGLAYPQLVLPSVCLLAVLMLGAVGMHIKVSDPPKKSAPALTMLTMSLILIAHAVSG